MKHSTLAACLASAAISCAQAPPHEPSRVESGNAVFLLGRNDHVAVRILPRNKGLASTPESLAVSFTREELEVFLGVKRLPLHQSALDLLERKECQGDMGGAHFSVRIWGALDHTVKASIETRSLDTLYEHGNSPRMRHGLLDMGRIVADNYTSGFSTLLIAPSEMPFGFSMMCGELDTPAEGGCVVRRDAHQMVDIQYNYCESMLPYWREIDDLYFIILKRIVIAPVISDEYRVGA